MILGQAARHRALPGQSRPRRARRPDLRPRPRRGARTGRRPGREGDRGPDDPFDVALLTDADIDGDPARLDDELSALSLMGGRRLVRLRLSSERAAIDRAAAEALKRHAEGELQPRRLLPDRGRRARPRLRRCARRPRRPDGAVAIPCYEDETGDVARLVREALAKRQLGLTARRWSCSSAACRTSAASPARRSSGWRCFSARAAARPPRAGRSGATSWASSPRPRWPTRPRTPSAAAGRRPRPACGARRPRARAGRRRCGRWAAPGPPAPRPDPGGRRRTWPRAAKASGVFWKQRARVPAPGPRLEPAAARRAPARRAGRRPRLQDHRLARPPDRRAPGADHRRPRAAAGAVDVLDLPPLGGAGGRQPAVGGSPGAGLSLGSAERPARAPLWRLRRLSPPSGGRST